ncbi:hypothetical protein K435DRAFT_812773 [Dendrothele bispora CBS 962.96]|uniref:Uncharacterized protein n=1 Tax=Dendrothele bispora (strain CBS 962.96) TaxID=1314807 RepID=A0A4S8KNF3_DENBC|nr:hypothetical protein K435DRAFT_812773 [Dendrothele bispora CBS 962.96]
MLAPLSQSAAMKAAQEKVPAPTVVSEASQVRAPPAGGRLIMGYLSPASKAELISGLNGFWASIKKEVVGKARGRDSRNLTGRSGDRMEKHVFNRSWPCQEVLDVLLAVRYGPTSQFSNIRNQLRRKLEVFVSCLQLMKNSRRVGEVIPKYGDLRSKIEFNGVGQSRSSHEA